MNIPELKAIILCLITLNLLPVRIYSQDTIEITYSENFRKAPSPQLRLPSLPKEERSSSSASIISADIHSDNEEVKKCVNYALSVWESQILNCDSIYIVVKESDMECDISTRVLYKSVGNEYVPTALYSYLYNYGTNKEYTLNGEIHINPDTNWDYSLGSDVDAGKSLAFAVMRGLARIMGFGSTVSLNAQGEYRFNQKRGYSLFDKLVIDSKGNKLCSIPTLAGRPNEELKNFVESGNRQFLLRAEDSTFTFELAPPPYSPDHQPFCFVKDNESLMRWPLSEGSQILQVDTTTKTILESLGWAIKPKSSVRIVGEDIDGSGLASAYVPHRFRVDGLSGTPTNSFWELNLPLVDGGKETIILADNNLSCTLHPIESEDKYIINQDGDISAVLEFHGNLNGIPVSVPKFRLALELKPYIEYAEIVDIENNTDTSSYNAHYKVKYRGASGLEVAVEEEYGSRLNVTLINEPYICYGTADNITAPFCAWIDFTAKNKYGKSVYTISLGPYGEILPQALNNKHEGDRSGAESIENDSARCEVYTLNGYKVGTFKSIDEVKTHIHNKTVIIRSTNEKGTTTERNLYQL